MRRTLMVVVPVLLVLSMTPIAQQRRWFELYDEAIQHIQRSEWSLAEDKLTQAKKMGPAPGRNVLRYGMLRDDFFPDFYLGVVYLNTRRPKEAMVQFQLARSQKLNPQDREFTVIGDLERRAQGAADVRVADDGPPPRGPVATNAPDVSTEVVPPAPPPVGPAPVDPAIAARQQQAEQVEQALRNRNVGIAKGALAALEKLGADPNLVATYATRVRTLDGEIQLAASERSAMRAFFSGDYRQTVSALDGVAAALGIPLSPRGQFYRACSLAALALRTVPIDNRSLSEARRQYGEAMKARDLIAPDRRYVSPKILQALGS